MIFSEQLIQPFFYNSFSITACNSITAYQIERDEKKQAVALHPMYR
jgi:hypothetical protein